ncbi:hypothetical protein F0562_015826 [Nyssa sinensis]|uniref:Sodium/calcium exchanger membrane region domain-containing protein n=1 Tax=Nyssa sinensis TaxID=561372 RepID=A0A5J4ZMH9_9ASTE|nr:hypothetical protein F0562_015826 [Nyssa sinensis]
MTAGLIGIVFGNLVFMATKNPSPPKHYLFPWHAAGFLMSVTWTYIIAEELVSLLVSFGNILEISPSILGLTVLAWGNSIGDLIANTAMAMKGGPDGAQIAISGCYARPLLNTLVGIGLSFVFASWSEYPSSYVIPRDPYLYETLGFLMGGLLWALVILPKKNLRLGSISTSLSNLGELTYLTLANNKFEGQVPDFFAHLPKLSVLRLAGNNFTGQVPSSLFNLSQLFILDISSNQLTGSIPLQMFLRFEKLEYLDLSYNNLSLIINNSINSTFPQLRTLFLSSCNITVGREIPFNACGNKSNLSQA